MLSCVAAVAVSATLSGISTSQARWQYSSRVNALQVTDSAGSPMIAPFLGGFDLPRPALVDINGDGRLDLFVQERTGDLIHFERTASGWAWRSDRFQDLNIGEWYRFVDLDRDGDKDLLSEMMHGYMRAWRNEGSATSPRFVALGDTVRDVDGLALAVDRQNILDAVDIDCNNKLDLFIGKVQGVVDRYEQEGNSPDGAPRFRLLEEFWQGIEVIGPETPGGRVDTTLESESGGRTGEGGRADSVRRHGANTLMFADVDGRGLLDLFWGDFFEQGLLRFENAGSCAQPDFTTKPSRFPQPQPLLTSGYNAPTFGDVNGDGGIDMVVGVIGGAYSPGKTAIENLFLLEQAPRGMWSVKSKRLITSIDVGTEAAPAVGDINGDSLPDLIIGSKLAVDNDRTGTLSWFENVGTRNAPAFRERGLLPISGEFNYAPVLIDLDNDGLRDMVVGTWRDRVQFFRNSGTRTVPRWTLADSALITITRGTNTTPSFGDLNGDGLIDAVIGEASGVINLYLNRGAAGAPKFELVSEQFQDIRVGRRSVPFLFDLDADQKMDMLIGNADGEIQLWRGVGSGNDVRFERDMTFVLRSYPNAMPIVVSLFGDARADLLVGTAAGGLRFFERER